MQSISLPDTPSESLFTSIPDKVDTVSEGNLTVPDKVDTVSNRNRPIPGQIKPKNKTNMNEQDEIKANRTEMGHYRMSPEIVEVETIRIQLNYEWEMRILDIERDLDELLKQEIRHNEKNLEE